MDFINQAIFSTNQFAMTFPEQHVQYWSEFERMVPASKRSGYYGADSVAYINFLNEHHANDLEEFDNSIGGLIVG